MKSVVMKSAVMKSEITEKAKQKGRRGSLSSPILLKTGGATPWPEGERHFFVLARDGLFRCRQHEFFNRLHNF